MLKKIWYNQILIYFGLEKIKLLILIFIVSRLQIRTNVANFLNLINLRLRHLIQWHSLSILIKRFERDLP
ncbi:hypothetical protein LSO9J_70048 [Candidatus Liberibacter solanacearum]